MSEIQTASGVGSAHDVQSPNDAGAGGTGCRPPCPCCLAECPFLAFSLSWQVTPAEAAAMVGG